MNNRKNSHFFAMLSRMKNINRWGLMRNTHQENIEGHSLQVAMIAHALVVIKNRRFGGQLNADRAAILGIYHDATEILTGDLPTPVKYYNPEIRDAYKKVEDFAKDKLVSLLPDDLRPDFSTIFYPQEADAALLPIIKAADRISALIKCMEEKKAGNTEFTKAYEAQYTAIKEIGTPEVNCFLEEFLPSFELTLDEQD